jgi:thiamine-monophosphate kinase
MDSSDGLAYTLNEIAEQSKVKIIVNNYPMSEEIKKLISLEGRDPLKDALYGGEEYQMVFTVNPKKESFLQRLAKKHNVKIYNIGTVVKGKGVYLSNGDKVEKKGWVFTF